MAVGAPSLWNLQVQWDGTTFVDETASLKAGSEVTVTRGRGSSADDIQPGVLSGDLDNTGGRFTPDNALSPLWPNLNDGEPRTRFTVTIGGVASDRHRGRVTLGQPTWPGGDASKAEVSFESVGVLGQESRTPLRCDFVERHLFTIATGKTVDIWPFDEVVDASTSDLRNLGNGKGTAALVRATTGAGTASTEDVAGIDLESSIKVSPKNGVGPVIVLQTGIAVGSVEGLVIPFRTDDRPLAGGASKYLAQGLGADGSTLWSLRIVDNAGQADINLYDVSGALVATLAFGFAAAGTDAKGDDQWYSLLAQLNVTGLAVNWFLVRNADDTVVGSASTVLLNFTNIKNTRMIVLGGLLPAGRTPGKQVQCTPARFGAAVMTNDRGSTHTGYLEPEAVEPLQARFQDIALYRPYVSSSSGTRNNNVRKRALAGRDPLDVLAELARTTGAVIVESRTADDTLLLRDADLQRSDTVALTLDISDDVDGRNGWPTRKGGRPSQVTANWSGGKVTYTHPTRVAGSKSVDTAAVDSGRAYVVASSFAAGGERLRVEKLRVDIAGSNTALWPTLKDLEVGARIRVTLGSPGTPFVTQWGRTYVDVYAVGWTEHYSFDAAWWEIDTEPADDPVQGAYAVSGSPLRRRKYGAAAGAMTVTGGTCVGGTGTGTIVVTTATGPTFTTTAAAYPMDLNWHGEEVTVSGPPASAVSPQTLTVSARGVGGTVARAHAAGEPVNVAMPAAYGL